MLDQENSRFRKAEEALRFFFRLRELLHNGQTNELAAGELPAATGLLAGDALDDYRSIGWSMRSLDEVALWLLGQVYGPTGFGVRRRTFSHVGEAWRRAFPQREFRMREVILIHERALGVVKRGLREMGMIRDRPPRTVRQLKPHIETMSRRLYLRVGARGWSGVA